MKNLIFVYNADSNLIAKIIDFGHKIISPKTYNCRLCFLTYSNIGIKKDWKNFIKTLEIKTEFLHKDEFEKKYKINIDLPALVLYQNKTIKILIDRNEINNLNTLEELINLTKLKLKI